MMQISNIFDVSADIMAALCSQIPSKLASTRSLDQWRDYISARMWTGGAKVEDSAKTSRPASVGGWMFEKTSSKL
jgi:hypothetical protein